MVTIVFLHHPAAYVLLQYAHTHAHPYTHTHMHTHTRTHIHTHLHQLSVSQEPAAYVLLQYVHAHIHPYIHTHTHANTHMHAHTHPSISHQQHRSLQHDTNSLVAVLCFFAVHCLTVQDISKKKDTALYYPSHSLNQFIPALNHAGHLKELDTTFCAPIIHLAESSTPTTTTTLALNHNHNHDHAGHFEEVGLHILCSYRPLGRIIHNHNHNHTCSQPQPQPRPRRAF